MGSQMVELRVARCSVAAKGYRQPRPADSNMDVFQLFLTLVYLNRITLSQPVAGQKTCKYKNKGVEYEIGEDFPPPWKYACNGCTVNGKIVCQGTVVRDLYRWWYLAQCDRGRMLPVGRQWGDVVEDPRFTNTL